MKNLLQTQTSRRRRTHKRPAAAGLLNLPFYLFPLFLLGLPLPPVEAADLANENALYNHPSTYLSMHGQDPVHWNLWSRQVLEQSQKRNKPILVSSGYFACHWCHVMQQENYHDPEAARLINQGFIPVKIDRELNTDLDTYLIEFSQRLTGRAGWPQHVLITPEGYPFAAFGYLPNPDFKRFLQKAKQLWRNQNQEIRKTALAAANSVRSAHQPTQTEIDKKALLSVFTQTLEKNIDDFSGGLKGSHKFPNTPLMLSLLKTPDFTEKEPVLNEWLQLTLDKMREEHLIDHIHGGFFRYTVDPEWQIPHFEKMTYDNAQLATLYFLGSQAWQRSEYLQTAEETLGYLKTHLFNPQTGLFISSQSALDRQGNEGGSYLYSRQQLKARLDQKAYRTAKKAWQLDQAAPFFLGWLPKPTSEAWPSIRQALKKPVSSIPSDRKAVLSWNGLALSAFLTGYQVTEKPAYLKTAKRLASRLLSLLEAPSPPRALSAEGKPIGQAMLEDYAYILQALIQFQELEFMPERQHRIERLANTALSRFLSPVGWQSNRHFLLPGQKRRIALTDQAQPSPTAVMECLTPDSGRSRIKHIESLFRQNPLDYASYLNVFRCAD